MVESSPSDRCFCGMMRRHESVSVSMVTVRLDKEKFYPSRLTIHAGQSVKWELDSCFGDGETIPNIYQTLTEDINSQAVDGGYRSKGLSQLREWSLTFNRIGDYHFQWTSFTPMTVTVVPKIITDIEVSKHGFSRNVFQLYKGDLLRWKFTGNTGVLHVQKVDLCIHHGGFKKTNIVYSSETASVHEMRLSSNGLHYYRINDEDTLDNLCVLQVVDRAFDVDIAFGTAGFDQDVLSLTRGDRLWCKWAFSKSSSSLPSLGIHCVKSLDGKDEGGCVLQSSMKIARGLLSYVFDNVGLYELRDATTNAVCIIKVLPKNKQHSITVSEDCFMPAVGSASQGDLIWLTFESIQEQEEVDIYIEEQLNTGKDKECLVSSHECCDPVDQIQAGALRKIGLASFFADDPGVISLKCTRDESDKRKCDLIVYPKPKHRFVDIASVWDNSDVVRMLEGDILWLEWKRKEANLTSFQQVRMHGELVPGLKKEASVTGAINGIAMIQIDEPGIKHFAGFSGSNRSTPVVTVTVEPKPKLHKVRVTPRSVSPDPVFVGTGDVVSWVWPKASLSFLAEVDVTTDGPGKYYEQYNPRRCISRRFDTKGVFHFSCGYSGAGKQVDTQSMLPESVWCSVICDRRKTPNVIQLSSAGFSTTTAHISKANTLLVRCESSSLNVMDIQWTALHSDETDVEVNSSSNPFFTQPAHYKDMIAFQLDRVGKFILRANHDGSNYDLCVICVNEGEIYDKPLIKAASNVANVEEGHVVQLETRMDDSSSNTLYTLDGSLPSASKSNTASKMLNASGSVALVGTGLMFVRAIIVGEKALPSYVTTSRRFWVMDGDEQTTSIHWSLSESQSSMEQVETIENLSTLAPFISVTFLSENSVRLEWRLKDAENQDRMRFKVQIDSLPRGPTYPSECTAIVISGLTAGRSYAVALMMLNSADDSIRPVLSNELLVTCPTVTALNGPIISLESSDSDNEVSVLWMANYHPEFNVKAFHVLLNGNKIGEVLAEDAVGYCSVLLNGLDSSCLHDVVVKAETEGDSHIYPSNSLEFVLPLRQSSEVCQKLLREQQPTVQFIPSDNRETDAAACVNNEPQEVLFFSSSDCKGPFHIVIMANSKVADVSLASLSNRLVHEVMREALIDVVAEDLVASVLLSVRDEDDKYTRTAMLSSSDGDQVLTVHRFDNTDCEVDVIARKLVQEVVDDALTELRTQKETDKPMTDIEPESNHVKNGEAIDAPAAGREIATLSPLSLVDGRSQGNIGVKETASKLVNAAMREAIGELTNETAEKLAADAIRLAFRDLEMEVLAERNSPMHAVEHRDDAAGIQSEGETTPIEYTNDTRDLEMEEHKESGKDHPPHTPLVSGRWISAQNAQADPPSDISIRVISTGTCDASVTWNWNSDPFREIKAVTYNLFVLGLKFADNVNSRARYAHDTSPFPEAWPSSEDSAARIACTQHLWETKQRSVEVQGLKARYTYSIWVVVNDSVSGERVTVGKTLYTMPGPPSAPVISVEELLDRGVLLSWRPSTSYGEAVVNGYLIFLNGKEYGSIIPAHEMQAPVTNLEPGSTNEICLIAIACGRAEVRSKQSEAIIIRCPQQPCRVDSLVQVNVEEFSAILLSWRVPDILWQQLEDWQRTDSEKVTAEDVGFLVVVNGVVMHTYTMTDGEETILHKLTDCTAGVLHDIAVKTFFKPASNGPRNQANLYGGDINNNGTNKSSDVISSQHDTQGENVFGFKSYSSSSTFTCGCSSDLSNQLIAAPISPPSSPKLLVKQLSRLGIEVVWEPAKVFGFAKLAGYQLFVNGKLSGNVLPPDSISTRVSDLVPGYDYVLSLTALTDHRIGCLPPGSSAGADRMNLMLNQRILDGATTFSEAVVAGHEGCLTGPLLVVYYRDLLYPFKDVIMSEVSGTSAKISWHLDRTSPSEETKNDFYVTPMSFAVSLWRTGNKPKLVKEKETTGSSVILSNLELGSEYTVTVRSRTPHLSDKDLADTKHPFVCWEESDAVSFTTREPPLVPCEFHASGCSRDSADLRWTDFVDRGVPVLSFALQLIIRSPEHVVNGNARRNPHWVDIVSSDKRQLTINGLSDQTEYLCTLYLITLHSDKADIEALKNGDVINDVWTPCVSTVAITSGYDGPSCIEPIYVDGSSVRLQWIRGVEYDSFETRCHYVCWSLLSGQGKSSDNDFKDRLEVPANLNEATVKGLKQSHLYAFHVETQLMKGDEDGGLLENGFHDSPRSSVVVVWTRSPPCSPVLIAHSMSAQAIHLSWNHPRLVANSSSSESITQRSLLGYKLQLDEEDFCVLPPSDTSFELVRPKPGKEYEFVLFAVTCSEESLPSHKQKWQRLVSEPNACLAFTSPDHEELGDIDYSKSQPVNMILPKKNAEISFAAVECRFNRKKFDRDIFTVGPRGSIVVRWQISSRDDFTVDRFIVTWWTMDKPGDQHETEIEKSTLRKYEIADVVGRSVYYVRVTALIDDGTADILSPIVHCQVPGPPDPPKVTVKTVGRNSFTLAWSEPRMYGNVKIGGYHVFINDSKIGKLLPSTSRSCTIPCRIGRSYKAAMTTVSTDLAFAESELSEEVIVNARSDSKSTSRNDNDRQPTIEVSVITVGDTAIDIEWVHHDIGAENPVEFYIVQYSSVSVPTPNKITVLGGQKKYSIKRCRPGTTYFITLSAYDKRKRAVARSANQLTVQTSAQLETPALELRECSASKIIIEWKKPTQYGDAHLTGYLLKLDGREYAEIEMDDTSYQFSFCEPCRSYRFELQALCSKRSHHSKMSEPLIALCPGAEKVVLSRIQTADVNSIKIGWRKPVLHGAAKVLQYFVIYCRSEPGHVALSYEQIISDRRAVKRGPYSPAIKQDVINDLDPFSMYHVLLRVDLTPEDCPSIFSLPIRTKPAIPPNPPIIEAKILDLQERLVKEEKINVLLASRDYCCREVSKLRELRQDEASEKQINQLLILIAKIDNEVRTLLRSLSQLTGFVRVSLSWTFPGHDGDAVARGYRLLCDNEPYGDLIPPDCQQSTIQILCDGEPHEVSMVTVTDHPIGPSSPSNVITVKTKDFLPFSLFCFHDVHKKGASWPDRGCCLYRESFVHEHNAKWNQVSRGMSFRGMMTDSSYPLTAKGVDVFDGYSTSIANRTSRLTVVVFYTFWCKASVTMMKEMEKFSRDNPELDVVTCCTHGSESPSHHRLNMIERLPAMGFSDRPNVRHLCICQQTPDAQVVKKTISTDRKSAVTTAELCDVVGVPSLMILNLGGEVSWQGRICAATPAVFSVALHHFLDLVRDGQCTQPACHQCSCDESCSAYLDATGNPTASTNPTFLTGTTPRNRVVLRQNLFPEISSSKLNHKKKAKNTNGGLANGKDNSMQNGFPSTSSAVLPTPRRPADNGTTSNGSYNRLKLEQRLDSDKQMKSRSLQSGDFPSISPHPPKQKRKDDGSSSHSFKRAYSAPMKHKK